jgi:hypothetical protein
MISHVRHSPRRDVAHARAVDEAQVHVHVHVNHDAGLPERVGRARDDVAVKERAVEHPQRFVLLVHDALVAAKVEPAHLGVRVGDDVARPPRLAPRLAALRRGVRVRGVVVVRRVVVAPFVVGSIALVVVGLARDARDESDRAEAVARVVRGGVGRVDVGDDVFAVDLRARVGAEARARGVPPRAPRGGGGTCRAQQGSGAAGEEGGGRGRKDGATRREPRELVVDVVVRLEQCRSGAFFTHPAVSTFDRTPFQLTDELHPLR